MGETAYGKLGVELVTPEETEAMANITQRLIFERDYKKSDAIIDLMTLFKMEDTPHNRRFALAMAAFGGAFESAQAKMKKIMDVMLTEMEI